MNDRQLTHVVGTFLIQAEGAFLNGAGLGEGEDRNVSTPKTFSDIAGRVPYVSAQAWKRWLRETFKEENPNEPHAELVQKMTSGKGSTSKIGTDMDPVKFPEDDIFGYMRAEKGQGRAVEDEDDIAGKEDAPEKVGDKTKGKEKVAAVMRAAPFASSILTSVRKSGWQGLDEGFVHLKEGTPLPYSTQFYNTQLQGVFGLNYSRLGEFRNEGDRIELDRILLSQYKSVLDKDEKRNIYRMKNNPRKMRAAMILKSLAVMRGGAKQAAFATDVAPKFIILAGLSCGNLIFNDLFEDTKTGPTLKLDALKEVISDYAKRLVTPVFIGARTGYLQPDSEKQLREWATQKDGQVMLTTPIQAVDKMTEALT